jgi:hypothetical protein
MGNLGFSSSAADVRVSGAGAGGLRGRAGRRWWTIRGRGLGLGHGGVARLRVGTLAVGGGRWWLG